jgi:hypothetical protein
MSKFTKGLGIVALALVVSAGGALAQRGGHGGGWHGGGYRGGYYGGYYGGGWGWGGFAAGAILGGLLAAPYYYGGPRYYYGPPPEDAVAYCMQRFKSYDPRSGTYLGYDGHRHPCP